MSAWKLVAAAMLPIAAVVAFNPDVNSAGEATHTTLASSRSADGRMTLTASVSTRLGFGVPGGTVRFVDDTTLMVLGWADAAQPVITVDRLPPGSHRLYADYGGRADQLAAVFLPSQSAVITETVRVAPEVALLSSDNPCRPGAAITLTAAITGRGDRPSGAVTFRDGAQVLAAHVGLDSAGTASFTTSALADGARVLTAEYEGDARYAPAVSRALHQDVGAGRLLSSALSDGSISTAPGHAP